MGANLRGTKAGIVMALTLASMPCSSKSPRGEDPVIAVRVHDYVNLSAQTRDDVEANAKRILSSAGIALQFIDCYRGSVATGIPVCTAPLGPADLVLRILQPHFAAKGNRRLGSAAMTSEGGACITVFINPAQQKPTVGRLSNGNLLGHAVAHEIGHMLLGANSHSPGGIMRPVWSVVDEELMVRRALLFDAGQVNKMRLTLTRLSR